MGFKIAAVALWAVLFLQVFPTLLWSEGTNFRAVRSPLARQITREAEAFVNSGLGLFYQGSRTLSLASEMGR